MSELHQTWSSFQRSVGPVVVKDIFLSSKSNQTRKNMLLKETDTIDAILIVVFEQNKFVILTKLGALVAMFDSLSLPVSSASYASRVNK